MTESRCLQWRTVDAGLDTGKIGNLREDEMSSSGDQELSAFEWITYFIIVILAIWAGLRLFESFWVFPASIVGGSLLWALLFRFLGRGKDEFEETKESVPIREVREIIRSYQDLLASNLEGVVADESLLPTAKKRIKKALSAAIIMARTDKEREYYRVGYLFLASFQPGVGTNTEALDQLDFIEEMSKESDVLQSELDALQENIESAGTKAAVQLVRRLGITE